MSTPYLGRECVIIMDGSTVALGKNVTFSLKADEIEEHAFGSQDPQYLAQGNRHYDFVIDILAVATNTPLTKFTSPPASGFTLEIRPEGTGSDKKKYTLTGCVIFAYEQKQAQEPLVLANCKGKGMAFAEGTQT
jgi:hypothetical protein